jgi:hypothetical protein
VASGLHRHRARPERRVQRGGDIVQFFAFGASQGLGVYLSGLIGLYSLGRYAAPRELAVGGPLIVVTYAIHEYSDPAFQFGWLSGGILVDSDGGVAVGTGVPAPRAANSAAA